MFNIPSQNPLAQNEMYEEFLHLMDIQVPLACSSEVKVLRGAISQMPSNNLSYVKEPKINHTL